MQDRIAGDTARQDIQGRSRKLVASVLFSLSMAGLVSACGTLGGMASTPTEVGAGGVPVATASSTPTAEDAELLAFVASGAPGNQGTVLSEQGGAMQVAIGNEYVSARGRPCRHFTLWRGSASQPSHRLACQGEAGWELIRPLRGVASR